MKDSNIPMEYYYEQLMAWIEEIYTSGVIDGSFCGEAIVNPYKLGQWH